MSSSTTLGSMPIEVVESIASWLKPAHRMREDFSHKIPDSTEFFQQYELRHSCQSMRLVCKDFAKLQEINSGLFHTFYVTPSTCSLDQFRALSEHKFIRNFVKHISFTMPQLPDAFSMQDYECELYQRLTIDYERKLQHGQGEVSRQDDLYGHLPLEDEDLSVEVNELDASDPSLYSSFCRDPRSRYLARKYFDGVFQSEKRREHYAEIVHAMEEQQVLCKDGGFARLGGSSLAKLPQATSISIRQGYGSALSTLIESITEPRMPLFRSWPIRGDRQQFWKTDFITLVLDLLAVSKTAVTHLYTDSPMQIPHRIKLPVELNLQQFSHLQTLRIELNDDKPTPWTKEGWNNFIQPMLLKGSKTLKVLSLRRERAVGCHEVSPPCAIASLDEVLQITFPRLQRIELVGAFAMTAGNITTFLSRHPQLREFYMPFEEHERRADGPGRVNECWRPNNWWRSFYKALYMHPGLQVKGVIHRFFRDTFLEFSSDDIHGSNSQAEIHTTKNPPQWCKDLQEYLNNGRWTEELKDKYGPIG